MIKLYGGDCRNLSFPLALMEYLCKLTKTPNGGIVLDPFAGSGTTGLACVNVDRNCILVEKEAQYCEIIKERMPQIKFIPPIPKRRTG